MQEVELNFLLFKPSFVRSSLCAFAAFSLRNARVPVRLTDEIWQTFLQRQNTFPPASVSGDCDPAEELARRCLPLGAHNSFQCATLSHGETIMSALPLLSSNRAASSYGAGTCSALQKLPWELWLS